MLNENLDAGSAAVHVGYESASQFSRNTAGCLERRLSAISRACSLMLAVPPTFVERQREQQLVERSCAVIDSTVARVAVRFPDLHQAVGTVPPSMTYSVPVIAPALGETTNAMRSATSRGLAGRPSGMPPSDFMMICLPPS